MPKSVLDCGATTNLHFPSWHQKFWFFYTLLTTWLPASPPAVHVLNPNFGRTHYWDKPVSTCMRLVFKPHWSEPWQEGTGFSSFFMQDTTMVVNLLSPLITRRKWKVTRKPPCGRKRKSGEQHQPLDEAHSSRLLSYMSQCTVIWGSSNDSFSCSYRLFCSRTAAMWTRTLPFPQMPQASRAYTPFLRIQNRCMACCPLAKQQRSTRINLNCSSFLLLESHGQFRIVLFWSIDSKQRQIPKVGLLLPLKYRELCTFLCKCEPLNVSVTMRVMASANECEACL